MQHWTLKTQKLTCYRVSELLSSMLKHNKRNREYEFNRRCLQTTKSYTPTWLVGIKCQAMLLGEELLLFTMKGGILTGRRRPNLRNEHTHSVITLEDVTITNQDSSGRLLAILGNGCNTWLGTAGANGTVDLTTTNQTLTGATEVDTVSTFGTTGKGTNFTGTHQYRRKCWRRVGRGQ